MAVLGMRTTYNITSDERPKAWREGIFDEYPDAAPLCHVIFRTGKEKVSDYEFNWHERRYPTRELTVGAGDTPGASTAGTADTLAVGTGEAYNCKSGSLLWNETTDETVLVYEDPTTGTALKIKRGWGVTAGTVTAAWTAAQKVQVVGNAQPQGASVGSAIAYDPTRYYNYCQILRNVADTSRTLAKTMLRTGDKRKDAQKEALLLHETDKEWAFLLGVRAEVLTESPGPRYSTGGLKQFVTTNVTDFTTTGLTLAGWNTFLEKIFRNGNDERLLLCGSSMLMALEDMARAYTYTWADVGKQDVFGMNLRKWITSFGTLYIKEHKLMTRNTALKGWGFVVSADDLVYRFVDDTDWLANREDPGDDRFIGEYLAEVGLELHNEYNFGIAKGVTTFVA